MKDLFWKNSVDTVIGKNFDLLYDWENGNVVSIPTGMVNQINNSMKAKLYSDEIKDTVSELFARGLIVKEEKEIENEVVKNTTVGAVYYMPSMSCNFRCTYCFLGKEVSLPKKERMDNETIIASVNFIVNEIKRLNLKKIKVLLFGGEPTLCIDKHIRFMELLNEKAKIDVEYSLITNGYILPYTKICDMIKEGLNNIQITLDGTKDIHDKRRILCNGEGTYTRILQNIIILCKKGISVCLRINIDSDNYQSIIELINILKSNDLTGKLLLQFVPVDPSSYSKASGYDKKVLQSFESIYRCAFSSGFEVAPWNRSCSIREPLFLAIAPNGDLYKCPCFVGEEACIIGSVDNGYNCKYEKYLEMKIEKKCVKCKYFRLCRGGCVSVKESIEEEKAYCIEEAIRIVHLAYIKEKYDREINVLRYKELLSAYVRGGDVNE